MHGVGIASHIASLNDLPSVGVLNKNIIVQPHAHVDMPQEVAVPYMLDQCHPEDTVFFFFESDFRCVPKGLFATADMAAAGNG